MDYSQVFEISATGMHVQKLRLEVAAHNLANANSVSGTDGQPYHPLHVVSKSATKPSVAFDTLMGETGLTGAAGSVEVDASAAPRWVYDPGHPNADASGMVQYPGVNHLTQMVTITEALRAYEANLAAMQAAKTMASRALDIGGNS